MKLVLAAALEGCGAAGSSFGVFLVGSDLLLCTKPILRSKRFAVLDAAALGSITFRHQSQIVRLSTLRTW